MREDFRLRPEEDGSRIIGNLTINELRSERFKSIIKDNKAKKLLGYTAKVKLKSYIKEFIKNNKNL